MTPSPLLYRFVALVRAGRHSAADYLTLAAGHGREHSRGVLDEVAHGLGFVREYLTEGATRDRFSGFVRTLLRPIFDEVGFTAAPGDGDDRRALRATLIATLGNLADDPDLVSRARSAADRAAAGGAADATTASAVIRVAARHGDAKLLQESLEAVQRTAAVILAAISEKPAQPETQFVPEPAASDAMATA